MHVAADLLPVETRQARLEFAREILGKVTMVVEANLSAEVIRAMRELMAWIVEEA